MIKRKIALALASLLLLTSCGAAEPEPLPSLTEYQTQDLEWRDCYGKFQCSNLLVPINYQDLFSLEFYMCKKFKFNYKIQIDQNYKYN